VASLIKWRPAGKRGRGADALTGARIRQAGSRGADQPERSRHLSRMGERISAGVRIRPPPVGAPTHWDGNRRRATSGLDPGFRQGEDRRVPMLPASSEMTARAVFPTSPLPRPFPHSPPTYPPLFQLSTPEGARFSGRFRLAERRPGPCQAQHSALLTESGSRYRERRYKPCECTLTRYGRRVGAHTYTTSQIGVFTSPW